MPSLAHPLSSLLYPRLPYSALTLQALSYPIITYHTSFPWKRSPRLPYSITSSHHIPSLLNHLTLILPHPLLQISYPNISSPHLPLRISTLPALTFHPSILSPTYLYFPCLALPCHTIPPFNIIAYHTIAPHLPYIRLHSLHLAYSTLSTHSFCHLTSLTLPYLSTILNPTLVYCTLVYHILTVAIAYPVILYNPLSYPQLDFPRYPTLIYSPPPYPTLR